jgi:hypothetical protein
MEDETDRFYEEMLIQEAFGSLEEWAFWLLSQQPVRILYVGKIQ